MKFLRRRYIINPARPGSSAFYEARAEACFRLGDWQGLAWAVNRLIRLRGVK